MFQSLLCKKVTLLQLFDGIPGISWSVLLQFGYTPLNLGKMGLFNGELCLPRLLMFMYEIRAGSNSVGPTCLREFGKNVWEPCLHSTSYAAV